MDLALVWQHRDFLLSGTITTIYMTLGAITLGALLGLIIGMARLSQNRSAAALAWVYVTVIRGTPMLLQILFFFLGIPQIYVAITGQSISPDPILTGIIALGINSGAYMGEIVRAGIQSIEKGQMEAARSLGLSHNQAMRFVILPQAIRRIIPPLANEFIVLLKDSSLVSAIGAGELMYNSRVMGAKYYAFPAFLLGAAIVYLSLTMVFTHLVSRLERRLAVSD